MHHSYFCMVLLLFFTGVADPQVQHPSDVTSLAAGEAHAIEWLCSGNLLSTVLATMGDLVATLHKARRGGMSQRNYEENTLLELYRI